ncbi:MAG: hypothetical protein COX57_05510 [Alphaproteobacteria bacterium CG_4_10_14_0_2_um_filter_63_37]|nr:MAG: hypothetical protein AUJ55_12430 [Proteobacteria bacterium CG1_02_64_396]PJA25019.1 MAG: hypothetical protein COX57_05510 [Alphaproteobacteria bacterium CG_4_10_14_0_2_um_filter_63_37]
MSKRSIEVSLLGKKYPLRTDLDEGRLQRIVHHAEQTLKRVSGNQVLAMERSATLALLQVVDELIEAQEALEQQQRRVDDRAQRLVALVDRVLEAS